MAEKEPKRRPMECPRCAYDLSGQRSAAEAASPESFPTLGTCSECGLDFWWGDIFNPGLHKVPGFIEHQSRGLVRAAFKTWLRAIRPKHFWTSVRLEMDPQLLRIAIWLLILIVAPALIGAVVGTAFLLTQLSWYPTAAPYRSEFLTEIWSMGFTSRQYRNGATRLTWFQGMPVAELGPLAASLLVPLVFLCLPHTRRVSRVKRSHIARGAAYGLAWLVPTAFLKLFFILATCIMAMLELWRSGPFQIEWYRVRRLINDIREGLLDSSPLLLVIIMVWIMLWWHAALKHGWRVKQYNQVWWALMIPAWLIVAIAALVSRFGLEIF